MDEMRARVDATHSITSRLEEGTVLLHSWVFRVDMFEIHVLKRPWFIRWLSYGLRSTHLGVFIDGFSTATTLQATMTAQLEIGAFGKLGHKLMTSSDLGFNGWFIGNASHPKTIGRMSWFEAVLSCCTMLWWFWGHIQQALKLHDSSMEDLWLGEKNWGWTRLGDYFKIVKHRLRYPPVNKGIE